MLIVVVKAGYSPIDIYTYSTLISRFVQVDKGLSKVWMTSSNHGFFL
ncbi:MAG: hypothetical protein ACJA2G_002861 [Cognaticolwellia sp.]